MKYPMTRLLPVFLFGLLAGCQVTVGQPSSSLSYDDQSRWDDRDDDEEECENRYQASANMASYNRHTAMNDQLREFWAEDQRFYEEQGRRDCDD